MKRILGIAVVLGLVGSLTVMAQEIKPGKVEVIDLGKGVKLELEMVLVPAGKFKMGSPASEKYRNNDEVQHEVTLTKPFYMGKYEVTQEQWEAVMGKNPSDTKGAKLPVTNVSWEDCQEFIEKLNKKTDGGYRLPTEAEWEYACRAGTTTAYSVGDEITPKDAKYKDLKIGSPADVGSYKPNAFGLYDMHGNVWEWCEDRYGGYPAESVTDPKGPAQGFDDRVLRGGSFSHHVSSARSSNRGYNSPTFSLQNFDGFRLARTADFKQEKEAKAKQMKQEKEAKAKQMELANLSIEKEMVLVPAGKFKMGSPESEKGRSKAETQHEVTLTKPFYMGKYEVTQEQWEAVMGNNPSSKTKGAKLPVTAVSWEDCQEFFKKLNAKTNGGYRLPTESEWEYACRAGTSTAYSFGDKITPKDVNYEDSKINKPVAVGSYKPNAFGLYDMHGNVWEWCEDWYGEYPFAVTDPRGPATGKRRVLRGGSFPFGATTARSSDRYGFSPSDRYDIVGFRLARTP